MDNTKLVATAGTFDSRLSSEASIGTKNFVSAKQSNKNSSTEKISVGSFSIIRETLQSRGIQGESAELIIQAWRQPTKKQYERFLNKWLIFSSSGQTDPLNPARNVVIEFLYDVYKSGIQYSGIGTARSAVSGFLSICSGGSINIGNNVLVKKFMRGEFNKRPALPKYASVWNPDAV